MNRTLVACLVAVLLASCDAPPSSAPAAVEASFAQQVAAVRAGDETWILVEDAPLADDDLAALADLDSLTTLCIDHAGSRITPRGFAALARLPKLDHLRYRGGGVNDAALAAIVKLQGLAILNVPQGEFTDAGLGQLAELPKLELLRFGSPHVTDASMANLATFPSLKRLHLIDVPIADAGLAELAKIERLESLYIDGGSISDAAWDELFRQRPKLHVHINQEHHDRDPNRHRH